MPASSTSGPGGRRLSGSETVSLAMNSQAAHGHMSPSICIQNTPRQPHLRSSAVLNPWHAGVSRTLSVSASFTALFRHNGSWRRRRPGWNDALLLLDRSWVRQVLAAVEWKRRKSRGTGRGRVLGKRWRQWPSRCRVRPDRRGEGRGRRSVMRVGWRQVRESPFVRIRERVHVGSVLSLRLRRETAWQDGKG